ncbi:helix-turn-helix domain-containing protein [Haloplanus pelagicus]|jgi:predicted DNA binding protein|uniref:helix-turn-helix domain-containing protein n=1 Tax=Haloplanus pelagicus TaxID=2949995 RepID=UPI00203B113D|nr:helix-turn-helix domain-containing protein [Haloplanus sp. HW8-1]
MATQRSDRSTTSGSSQLKLKLRHPNCWMTEVTAAVDGRLLVNAVYTGDGNVTAHVVVHADTTAAVDDLVSAARRSTHTDSVTEMEPRDEFGLASRPVGKATRGLLVEFDPADSIHDAIVSRGYLPQEPLRIRDGYEYWTVAVDKRRDRMQADLDAIASENDAEITVRRVATKGSIADADADLPALSDRQREVFELARARGYYEWPRAVSATDLAEEVGVAKATVLEHLRKAEAKLLGP